MAKRLFALGVAVLMASPVSADQTGLYGGFILGSTGGATKIDRTSGGSFELDSGAPAAGILLGYEFRNPASGSSGWRYGLEGDLSYAKLDRTGTDATLGAVSYKQTFSATLRGRAGYDFGRLYLYGTGGLQLSDARVSTNSASAKSRLNSQLVLGAGVETDIGNDWQFRTEILATGSAPKFTPTGGGGSAATGSAVLRLGLTRRW